MSHSPLFRKLLQDLRSNEVAMRGELRSRRSILELGLSSTAMTLIAPATAMGLESIKRNLPTEGHRIGVVGAGLAGLTAAHELRRHGVDVMVMEASGRTGGRVQTIYNAFKTDVYIENGGEFVDSNHTSIRRLCNTFSIPLIDIKEDNCANNLSPQDYIIKNKQYSEQEVVEGFRLAAKKIADDLRQCGNFDTNHARELDQTSLLSYLENLPLPSWLESLLISAYEAEYGLAAEIQSSLNLIESISTDTSKKFEVYGDSDERYKICGGSSSLVGALSASLAGRVQIHKRLIKLREDGNRVITEFADGSSHIWDRVILAIPFTTLRTVQLDIQMSELKRRCIQKLAYGNSSKLILSSRSRPWREAGASGYLINDIIQNGWDAAQLQPENIGSGAYTVLLGGNSADALNQGDRKKISSLKSNTVDILNKIYPGSKENVGQTYRVAGWTNNPWSQGSYPSYSVGQWTTIAGLEANPVGRIHFAGDHTSEKFQGFMNGAAESGFRAAKEVLEATQKNES